MSEPKLIFKAELDESGHVNVTLGMAHEGFLCVALKKTGLFIDSVLASKQAEKEASDIVIPSKISNLLG